MTTEQLGEEKQSGSEDFKHNSLESPDGTDFSTMEYQVFSDSCNLEYRNGLGKEVASVVDEIAPVEKITKESQFRITEIRQNSCGVPGHNSAYLRKWGMVDDSDSTVNDDEEQNTRKMKRRLINISLKDIVKFLT